jgi:hypothetical protein
MFVVLAAVAGVSLAAEKKDFVNIGTAGIGGCYYPTGGYICGVLNKEVNITFTFERIS